MERQLPKYSIEGTDFLVDVEKGELRELVDRENAISFSEMWDLTTHYRFSYDPSTRNLPDVYRAGHSDIVSVNIPQMVDLDPVRMAKKYGFTLENIRAKSDLEVILNQADLKERLTGKQPTIIIQGQLFYVDLHWDHLRPKDEFSTMGICISRIEDYQYDDMDKYRFVYDPKTFQDIDIDNDKLIAIPKDLVMIEIPSPMQLDPVGYASKHGRDLQDVLREVVVKQRHVAKVIPWKETSINEVIARNLSKSKVKKDQKANTKKNRGRRF